jgi:branched-chain amino acid transport system substrate-binding protein
VTHIARDLRRRFAGACGLGLALALGACGSGSGHTAHTVPDSRLAGARIVDIYSSLPLRGSSRAAGIAVADGIRLALAQAGGRAGAFRVDYRSLDDASRIGSWDAVRTAANARRAATDPRAVYYIGEFSSDASEVSMPILNQAGIPQVSPANTYVGLTQSIKNVTAPGEPDRFFPNGPQNYLRIIPADNVQAAADLLALREAGCTRVAVAYGRQDGAGLAGLLDMEKGYYGIDITSDTQVDPRGAGFRTYAARIRAEGANCLAYMGNSAGGAVQVAENVHAALPTARILASGDSCNRSWTDARHGGVPPAVDPFLLCTGPTLPASAYPGGRDFMAAYQKAYGVAGAAVNPYAIFGYEAMRLGLSVIAARGPNGADRGDVLRALFALRGRRSVLGTYGFDSNGDTTLSAYGLYKVGPAGLPVFDRMLVPSKVLSGS